MVRLIFFFNDTATTEIYTLSLHDALPISARGLEIESHVGALRQPAGGDANRVHDPAQVPVAIVLGDHGALGVRSEEHTSELQSRQYLVCRLLLEKKKHQQRPITRSNSHGS